MNRLVIISGCSGGGKSTLITDLKRRGFSVVEEPGRRIVQAELLNNGKALPWIVLHAFLQKVIVVALDDIASVSNSDEWVFFDRGLIDAVIGLQHLTGQPIPEALNLIQRYHHRVFLAPLGQRFTFKMLSVDTKRTLPQQSICDFSKPTLP